jgi:hypothetical protein
MSTVHDFKEGGGSVKRRQIHHHSGWTLALLALAQLVITLDYNVEGTVMESE